MRGFVGYVNGSDPVYSGAPRDESCAIVLTHDASGGALSGSIAFGDASAAPRVDVLPPASSSGGPSAPFWYYANYGVVAGFPYSLLDVERGDQRLRFGISAQQLWRSWCCHDGSFACPANVPGPHDMCDGSCSLSAKCSAPLPITVSFDLSIDGNTMEGVMVREEIGTPPFVPELRLRRQP
jgi:hypothetical protein